MRSLPGAFTDRFWVGLSCLASLLIALIFIFIWAPHPWGWEGFDHYHDLGRALARGEPFPTTDVPWGYAYFLDPFYRAFGDRPWIPLVVQAVLNATVPLLTYQFARSEFGDRIAVVAAIVTGWLSFNTVYASTQSADSVCTVLFLAAVVAFARARRQSRGALWYALVGLLLGTASQFRPNLILVPLLLALVLVAGSIDRRSLRRVVHASALVIAAAAALTPWVVRTYRLTGEIVPTSTHGGVQLWYGSLQTGPYLKSRAYNPRAAFEMGSFPYTSLDGVPPIITASVAACVHSVPQSVAVVYWTDRNAQHQRVSAGSNERGIYTVELTKSPAPTAYYFYLDTVLPGPDGGRHVSTPYGGRASPLVYFVSTDHLGDLDRHGDLLDVFDLVRLLRHVAWNEPIPWADRLDFDSDGVLSEHDIRMTVGALFSNTRPPPEDPALGRVTRIEDSKVAVTLRLSDGSTFTVPRAWSGRVTDLTIAGESAAFLLHATVPFSVLWSDQTPGSNVCDPLTAIGVNKPFYREQPHLMRRYTALAIDNIRRDPMAYFASVAYRAVRVFLIEGGDDPRTTQQFSGGGRVYSLAHAASVVVVLLFIVGIFAAIRRHAAIGLPLLLIGYIPATLALVLTNMRYSITVQPLVFVFVATAIVSSLEAAGVWPPPDRRPSQEIPARASS